MEKNDKNGLFPTQTNYQERGSARRNSFNLGWDELRKAGLSSSQTKPKIISKQKLLSPDLQSLVGKIQHFVDDIDNKIQNRVQLVKQVYLNEYKQQVLDMASQLKKLREKLDNEAMKERANERMFYLEEERDFFRHEVIKLNQQVNLLSDENKMLRRQIDEEKREIASQKQVMYNLQSKIIKLKNFNLQRSKIFQTASKSKGEPSTIETKKSHMTQRGYKKAMKNDDKDGDQYSSSINRLRGSQSMKAYVKLSVSHTQRTPSTINYPRLKVERLQRIEGYSQLLQHQQVIDQCINQIKREIYYRNLPVGDRSSKLHFNIEEQVSFSSFTKTDKKELIVKLLSQEKMLDQFYQFLFNNNLQKSSQLNQVNANELINNKLDIGSSGGLQPKYSLAKLKFSDSRFNTQQLNNLKSQFNKKIYDIKHNR